MEDCQSAWETMTRKNFEKSRAEFEARHDFQVIVSEAEKRGYRRITISEQIDTGSVDAYSWRGGVWVKI